MAFFTLWEFAQALIMSAVVGWIFKDVFNPQKTDDPDEYIKKAKNKSLNKDAWLFAALLVAPAIILHELGHKFVAMGFGLDATFHAAWLWLGIGIVMKLISGFIFFVPAFVSMAGTAPPYVFAIAALAGPAVNGILWFIGKNAPEWRHAYTGKHIKHRELLYWALFARINGFLAIFNLIPLPFFDGGQAIRYLFMMMGG